MIRSDQQWMEIFIEAGITQNPRLVAERILGDLINYPIINPTYLEENQRQLENALVAYAAVSKKVEIEWQSERITRSRDYFVDTPNGRYSIRRTGGRNSCYVLRLNGKELGRFSTIAEAKRKVT